MGTIWELYLLKANKKQISNVFILFVLQTTDKEAPGLIHMQSLAYLSGFPGSIKDTEQLRVKLPAAITGKIKQVGEARKWPEISGEEFSSDMLDVLPVRGDYIKQN